MNFIDMYYVKDVNNNNNNQRDSTYIGLPAEQMFLLTGSRLEGGKRPASPVSLTPAKSPVGTGSPSII